MTARVNAHVVPCDHCGREWICHSPACYYRPVGLHLCRHCHYDKEAAMPISDAYIEEQFDTPCEGAHEPPVEGTGFCVSCRMDYCRECLDDDRMCEPCRGLVKPEDRNQRR